MVRPDARGERRDRGLRRRGAQARAGRAGRLAAVARLLRLPDEARLAQQLPVAWMRGRPERGPDEDAIRPRLELQPAASEGPGSGHLERAPRGPAAEHLGAAPVDLDVVETRLRIV